MSGRETTGPNRRQILQAATLATASAWAGGPALAQGAGRSAVVFLSRSSNTRMLAGHLARRHDADLFEIRPRAPWPEDYDEMVAWATRWRESDRLLPLDAIPDFSRHDVIFLGFPIWGMSLPAPMRSLLSAVDLSGKTILPFITHGGYGAGSTLNEVRRLAPNAAFAPEFVLQCDQERDNLDAMQGWLDEVKTEIVR
ncbi:Flavodoxin [Paracoccus halophilus]|uniref:Flavodoxin n=1 Tax=Paracoccus halophilus TaxID=376733 RepID=A0A099EUU2_9RHOB|nr:flavodoxin [Paracoccus halophilus]KGJ02160.1 hypothetical protein IT41_18225 [Paracoccus halophilus]SFA62292.1 Flavodoxin [Paracoccus halophilus]